MLIIAAILSYIAIFALLTGLALYDYRHYILPDKLNAALALAFIFFHISTQWALLTPLSAFLGAAAGGGILLMIRTVANRYYNQDSLGLGDVKLMTAAGLGLGFPNIMLALTLGALLGLCHGVIMGLIIRRTGEKNISFGQINVPAGLGFAFGIAIVIAMQFKLDWM